MNKWTISAIVFGSLLFLALLFRLIFVYFVDNYELGYSFNKFTGSVERLDRTGYFIANPFEKVIHTIDLRPMQVRIEANNRVLNAKLVQFREEGLIQFIDLHGRGDYSPSSTAASGGNFTDIMKCYAYENYGNMNSDSIIEYKYKFIRILSNTNTANINK